MDPMEAIKQTFFQECEEQLAELEAGLMQMEGGATDAETVNAVFRAVHSIKGGAGAFGLDDLVRFAHVFETTLDDIRNGRLQADEAVMPTMLRASDILADLVAASRSGGVIDETRSAAVASELQGFCAVDEGTAAAPADDGMGELVFTPQLVCLDFDDDPPAPGPAMPIDEAQTMTLDTGLGWRITLTPRADLYAKANETARLMRELRSLGEVSATIDANRLPDLDGLEAEGAYLTWTMDLSSVASLKAVSEVFEFVEWDCDLSIEPLRPDMIPLEPFLLPMSVRGTPKTTPPSLHLPANDGTTREAQVRTPAETAPAPVATPAPPADAPPATIRVDLDRVDRLIDLVGELVINQAMLAQSMIEVGVGRHTALATGLDELEQLSREIQDSVMAIRAQPVKSVFQRMPRLVREVAAMTGKQVRLVTEGENTEVDKTVIERISDPLTHMIRNAIDHGLESPETRIANGKSAEGQVRLLASHRSGRIIIEVADDGAGINRSRVRQIAVDRGLIDPGAALTDEETDNLIFLPGFSTADKLSDISGRGVGMDVVKRSIQALGGRISIASQPGRGSTFTLSLPLTLAVLDGMVLTVAGQTLIAPITAIVETLKPAEGDARALGHTARVIRNRDAFVPLIDTGCALGFRTEPPPATSGVCILIETDGGQRAALQVDAIEGQRQVVIKSLEANYGDVPGIAAATIMGDGRVALILDIDAIEAVARGVASYPTAQPELALAG